MKHEKIISDLKVWFNSHKGAIIAFSGGIDSALVLYLSRKFLGKQQTIGVISNSESLKNSDYSIALNFAKTFDINLQTIHTDELLDENYNNNPANRCYFCKTHLYNSLKITKDKYPNFTLLNGTNKDDLGDYRPGLQAAHEHKVRSPLSELNLDKATVRALARHFGITIWDKPASPCLSSRVPYGSVITQKKLEQIEKAEDCLMLLGYTNVRVRHYGYNCKIEVPLDQIEALKNDYKEVKTQMENIGFQKFSIDEEGFISGKLNNALNLNHV